MTRLFTRTLAIILLTAGLSPATAQHKVLLANEQFLPQESDWTYDKAEVVDGRIYRLIQAEGLKLNKRVAGIFPMEYIPKHSFFASIEVSRLSEAQAYLNQFANSKVVKMKAGWKLSPNFYTGDIPTYTWIDAGTLSVWVRIFKDLSAEEAEAKLTNLGLVIVESHPTSRIYQIEIAPDFILPLAQLPYVVAVEEVELDAPFNFYSRATHNINFNQNPNVTGTPFLGTGVVVGVGDGGSLGDHQDYKGRVLQNAPGGTDDHAEHVTGTILGAGNINPSAKGMAPNVEVVASIFDNNLTNAPTDYDLYGMRLISGSYGATNGCMNFNAYNSNSIRTDNLPISRPTMTSLWSSGNDGFDNCSPVGSPWGTVAVGWQRAKNQLCVGNAQRNNTINGSSSRGPTPDGRLKPDIVGLGTGVYSSVTTKNGVLTPNSYDVKTGTSMSCPGVSGGVATMYEAYQHFNNGKDPLASTVKAILLNTAQDIGNAGPDFTYGYGKVNYYRAHKSIEGATYIVDSLTSGTNIHTISVPSGNVSEVRVTLCWTDTTGSSSAARLLVNDLDLEVKQGANTYLPWVLDPRWNTTTLNADAVRAVDTLNNVEQVTFTNPGTGQLTFEVHATNIPTSQQVYSIAYEFVMDEVKLLSPAGGESYQPGTQIMVTWEAGVSTTPMRLEYSVDSGANWINISSSIAGDRRDRIWSAPFNFTDKALMRLSRGGDTSMTASTFSVIGEVQNLSVASSCPDSTVILTWDSLPGISEYVLYKLGPKYMDSIGVATDTFFVAGGSDSTSFSEWYAIAPILGNSVGQRSVASNKAAGLFNCILDHDIKVAALSSPSEFGRPDCYPTSNVPIGVRLQNVGTEDATNLVVYYTVNGSNVVSDTVKDTIVAGGYLNHEFNNASLNMNPNTVYSFKLWVDYNLDRNLLNDTLQTTTQLYNSTLQSFPYANNFETFNICNTTINCGGTVCNLSDGWTNLNNNLSDDHDFRVISGPTPSANTGPFQDYSPGTATGQYLYLEGTNCSNALAVMNSPCFSIDTSLQQPVIEFAYHMYGSDIGSLSVDLITETETFTNITPMLVGNKGPNWFVQQIDVGAFKGKTISVRFRGITGSSTLSDLAIDDFKLFDQSVVAPVADFGFQFAGDGCVGDVFTFQDNSSGNISSYDWNFGPNATPATATTAGPHSVTFSISGPNLVILNVSNPGGVTQKLDTIDVTLEPNSLFTYSANSNMVSFQDASNGNPISWQWDFGDGSTSTLQNPTHTYSTTNNFPVTLIATNSCGDGTTYQDVVIVNWIGLDQLGLANEIEVFPNPAQSHVMVEIPTDLTDASLEITDLSGKLIWNASVVPSDEAHRIDLSEFAAGVYMLQVKNQGATLRNFRLVKEK